MALAYDGAIQRLDAFAHPPGIGPKGAQRIAFTCSTHPTRNHRADRRHRRKSKKKYDSVTFAATCAKPAHARSAPIRAATTA